MSNTTHFENSHSVWNERKMSFFEVWVLPALLMQNKDIWYFHGSLTLNNGELIFIKLWYAIVRNVTNFFVLFRMREKMLLFETWVSLAYV